MLNTFGQAPTEAEMQRIRRSPQYDGEKFVNPVPTELSVNPLRVLGEYIRSDASLRHPGQHVPVHRWTPIELLASPASEPVVSWWGHATLCIEVDGLRILTDPVFSERVSPVSFSGPKRMHAPPMDLMDLPPIDLVLISHNHYDHLDLPVIRALSGSDTTFIVPLGVASTLRYWGVPDHRIREVDWGESVVFRSVKITSTPARHFSGRGLRDRNKSLWTSYVLDAPGLKFFFCGDSGYFPGFADIGRDHGPFNLTAIGIGAYHRDWRYIHTDPEEAVDAHRMLRGDLLLPIHWATFDLALHPWSEPAERVIEAAQNSGVSLRMPPPGLRIPLNEAVPPVKWWTATEPSGKSIRTNDA